MRGRFTAYGGLNDVTLVFLAERTEIVLCDNACLQFGLENSSNGTLEIPLFWGDGWAEGRRDRGGRGWAVGVGVELGVGVGVGWGWEIGGAVGLGDWGWVGVEAGGGLGLGLGEGGRKTILWPSLSSPWYSQSTCTGMLIICHYKANHCKVWSFTVNWPDSRSRRLTCARLLGWYSRTRRSEMLLAWSRSASNWAMSGRLSPSRS